jgi:hypothetical protein
MKAITGKFTRPDGSPMAGAVLSLALSQDAVAEGNEQLTRRPAYITLGSDGSIPAGTKVWANDEIMPNGTLYVAMVRDSEGRRAYGPELWTIEGTAPIDLTLIVPPLQPIQGEPCTIRD